MSNILLDTLDKQPLICAEGYLFAMERRGYLRYLVFIVKSLRGQQGFADFRAN